MNDSWYSFLRRQGAVFEGRSIRGFGDGKSTYLDPKGTVFSPVDWMAIARISGPDAENFLQAQLTADVRNIGLETCCISGLCNPKGRLLAIFRVLRDGDDFLLLSDSGILPSVLKRLQIYVLRMKVSLAIEPTRVAIGLVGPSANHTLRALTGVSAETTSVVTRNREMCAISLGAGEKGYLVISPPNQLIESWAMIQKTAQLAGSDQWALFEMRSGVARITTTTQESFIPQSVNLDLVGGVSFSKGCYPGQEIIARVRYRGRLKHRLARARITNGSLPTPGDPIFLDTKATQRAGTIINSVGLSNGVGELLVTVPLTTSIGAEYVLDPTGRSIQLVELPAEISSLESL